jgi:hypothetical protein
MSAGGLPSACWGCGTTEQALRRKRPRPERCRPLSQEAAAGLVLQQGEEAQRVGGMVPGYAATHSLNILCNGCTSANTRALQVLAQQQRANIGRRLAKQQQGQSLLMAVLSKVWARVRSAVGRTAAQQRAAAEENATGGS